jgi:hypothetical protein
VTLEGGDSYRVSSGNSARFLLLRWPMASWMVGETDDIV